MMTTQQFEESSKKMLNEGITENDYNPDEIQIKIEERSGCQIRSHFFKAAGISDAKKKAEWLLGNTPCYDVVLYVPGMKAVTWCGINDREWNRYYGRLSATR